MYIFRENKENMHHEVILNKFKDGGLILPPIYIDEKYLYNAAEPTWVQAMLSKEMLILEHQESMLQFKEDDNPVIIKYKIK